MRHNTSVVNERCALCRYHGHLGNVHSGGQLICDYIGLTGHSRGCPAGAECDKFEPHNGIIEKRGKSVIITKNGEPRGWWSK